MHDGGDQVGDKSIDHKGLGVGGGIGEGGSGSGDGAGVSGGIGNGGNGSMRGDSVLGLDSTRQGRAMRSANTNWAVTAVETPLILFRIFMNIDQNPFVHSIDKWPPRVRVHESDCGIFLRAACYFFHNRPEWFHNQKKGPAPFDVEPAPDPPGVSCVQTRFP